jgi:hypothetical protein
MAYFISINHQSLLCMLCQLHKLLTGSSRAEQIETRSDAVSRLLSDTWDTSLAPWSPVLREEQRLKAFGNTAEEDI